MACVGVFADASFIRTSGDCQASAYPSFPGRMIAARAKPVKALPQASQKRLTEPMVQGQAAAAACPGIRGVNQI